MSMFRYLLVLFVMIFLSLQATAAEKQQQFFRDFWNPTFHTQRLNYCILGRRLVGGTVGWAKAQPTPD